MEGDNLIRTMTFLEKDYIFLQQHLFKDGNEQAAYLLCNLSESLNEIRFLVKEVIPVKEQHIVHNSSDHIYQLSDSYLPAITKAKKNNQSFIMVHCHPNNYIGFSDLDNSEEIKLLRYVYNRIKNKHHGSLVFNDENTFTGRILNVRDETYYPISKIRIIGETYRFINSIDSEDTSINNIEVFNRNILAFGEDLIKVLQNIHIGVVGCGGTGSAVIEELTRLGVGKLTLIDNDTLDKTNLTRVHESKIEYVGMPKVQMMKSVVESIGLGTEVIVFNEKLDNMNTAMKLKDCDIIFSCLDFTHFTRAIINRLSIFYYIPIIDTGIKFYSINGKIVDILGRIDMVTPNVNCLYCRKELNPKMIAAETMSQEEYLKLKKEGYAPELPNDKVQAMPYNTLIGTYAITEMLQLLTNFKGINNYHTIFRFLKNTTTDLGISVSKEGKQCICTSDLYLGKGDTQPFLSISW